MNIFRTLFSALLLSGGLLLPRSVHACACCAEPGTYLIHTAVPDAYVQSVLKVLKTEGPASLYYTAAGDDGIKGLGPADPYRVRYSFAVRRWTLLFTDGKGRKGNLYLGLPARMVQYKVDQHENGNDTPGQMIVLYKEWRFEGSISGDGIFATGLPRPAKYFFVLQGRGNMCDEAGNFTHWRLQVNGSKASYAFYGKLSGL